MTDPKSMARRLRAGLAARDVMLSHSEALELVAHQYGVRDWNTLAARPPGDPTAAPPEGPAVPILRIFDRGKAVEFYVDYLGFTLDWEHGGAADHSPLYAQVTRGAARLHLSEHHGDASPGGAALIPVADIDALHRELHDRDYDYARPGIRDEDWGRVLVVVDPFHNRLVFHQPVADEVEPRPSEAAAPIELTYDLACTVEEAFDAFTRRIDEWWHPAYAPDGLERVEIDGAVGGRVSMHLADGTTYPWGTVTVWSPPHRTPRRSPSLRTPSTRARSRVGFTGAAGGGGSRALRARRLDGGQRRGPGAVHRVEHPARPFRRGRRRAPGARRTGLVTGGEPG